MRADLPFVVTLDDFDEPGDIIDTLALGRFVAGDEPFARSLRLHRVRPDATLLPSGATPARRTTSPSGRQASLAVGEGWTLKVERWTDGTADLSVTARTDDLAAEVLGDASMDACEPPAPEDDAIPVGFWNQTRCGTPRRTGRDVTVQPWADIRGNYPAAAAGALERLMDVTAEALRGRVLLLHGPPGTGKTTVLRSLAHAWRKWCRFETILDPERLLDEPAYLMEVALGDDEDASADREARRHRLLVLEDCDELIRTDAKRGVGQALARLLNLTDGLLGQGLDVLVAITTNEPLIRLHPAVTRPGRCLAEVHIGRFPRAEAVAWLGEAGGIGPDGATLAELLALRNPEVGVQTPASQVSVGQYL